MPLNDSSCLSIIEARRHLGDRPPVCELFHQTLQVSDDLLDWCATGSHFIHGETLAALRATAFEDRACLPDRFYAALGFGDYVSIDSNLRQGSLALDLNLPLPKEGELAHTFDFVNNNGSTEHIFDQRAVYENIHNLCRVGGLMSHHCPTLNVMNISFYGVSPTFFFDIARANRYEILSLGICNRWGESVKVRLHPDDPVTTPEYVPVMPFVFDAAPSPLPTHIELEDFLARTHLADMSRTLSRVCEALMEHAKVFRPQNPGEFHITALFRKTLDAPFRVPFQHIALKEIEPDWFRERYHPQLEAHGLMPPRDAPA